MSSYVIGDIHNSLSKLNSILDQVSPSLHDTVYLLGDLFDRGADNPDPVGVFFKISGLSCTVKWIKGNHDAALAAYIYEYYGLQENKRSSLRPYEYNSFNLLKERLVEADMLNLADLIQMLPLHLEIEICSNRYLLAHAMTHNPADEVREPSDYLEGVARMEEYWEKGVPGYISFVGHTDVSYQYKSKAGQYLDDPHTSIWRNNSANVYMMDCGCGLPGGELAAICLETGERFYS